MSARHERSRLQGLAMESRSILLTIPRMSRRKTESQLPGTPNRVRGSKLNASTHTRRVTPAREEILWEN